MALKIGPSAQSVAPAEDPYLAGIMTHQHHPAVAEVASSWMKPAVEITASTKEATTKLAEVSAAAEATAQAFKKFGAVAAEVEEQLTTAVVAAKHKPQHDISPVEALAVELLDIERRMEDLEVKAMLARKEELRKLILSHHQEVAKDVGIVIDTASGSVAFSPCEKNYVLEHKDGLIKEIGMEAFMQLAKIGVTDLKKVVSENQVLALGKYVPGNTRTMKVTVKPNVKPAQ